MFSIKGLAALGIAIAVAASAAAQQRPVHKGGPRAEVALGYSYMRANATPGQCGCFNLNGGNAEVAVRVYRNLALVGDVTGEHAGTTSVPGQSLSLLSYTGGPRLRVPLGHAQRVTPFLQGLAGSVHGFDAPFPIGSGTTRSANALSVLAGGGLDVSLSRKIGLRVFQVDYGLNHLPNNLNNRENLLRVSAGVVLWVP